MDKECWRWSCLAKGDVQVVREKPKEEEKENRSIHPSICLSVHPSHRDSNSEYQCLRTDFVCSTSYKRTSERVHCFSFNKLTEGQSQNEDKVNKQMKDKVSCRVTFAEHVGSREKKYSR